MTRMVDLDTGVVLGVVDGRGSAGVKVWLDARSAAWRNGVRVVAIDPRAAFRKASPTRCPTQQYRSIIIHLVQLTGLRPSPTSRAVVTFRFSRRLTQGSAVIAGRPPPLATPRYVDHDAKCVSAGQVRCRCAIGASRTDSTPALQAPASQT
jgi:hypothetical protein